MSINSSLSMDFEECDSAIIDGTSATVSRSPVLYGNDKHDYEKSEGDSDIQEGDLEIATGAVSSTKKTSK